MFLKFHTRVTVYKICWFRIVSKKWFTKVFATVFWKHIIFQYFWPRTKNVVDCNMISQFHTRVTVYEICWFCIVFSKTIYKIFCIFFWKYMIFQCFRLWSKKIVVKDCNILLKFHTRVTVYEICWFLIVLEKRFTKVFASFFENTWFFSISDFGQKILLQRIAICFWNFTHELLFTRSVDSA